ncbi:MAG: clamp loader, small subunit [Caudoviricetes sp.]|nr:MAG: clamp loader, small subunit [Caudoviricetes sp.]
MKQLVEKYRPKKLDDYVFKDQHLKNKVISYIKSSENNTSEIPFPNLLLAGVSGTGKTSLAYVLCNECNVEKSDIMYINASRENNIDTVRNKINGFCSTMPHGYFKVIILDEFDRMSPAGQDALKSMFETYNSSVRFIATANSPEKIIAPLHGRFQVFTFSSLDFNTFLDRLVDILIAEEITFDVPNLEKMVNDYYPDLRKAINVIDQFTIDGKLEQYQKEDITFNENAIVEIIEYAKKGNAGKVKELSATIPSYEIEECFVYFYKNIETIVPNSEIYDSAFLIIKDAILNFEKFACPDILLTSTVFQLIGLNK